MCCCGAVCGSLSNLRHMMHAHCRFFSAYHPSPPYARTFCITVVRFRYGGFNSIPIVWWKATIVMHGIGCAVVLLATVGSLMTVFRCTQKYQRTVHNSAITGAIFIFIGLILFCVGFKDMKSGGQGSSPVCEICGSMTGPFVLQDCKIGDDLIFMIVGVVGIVIGT